MSSRLTVILYILLSAEAGIILVLLPWISPSGLLSDWGDNYFLMLAAKKLGAQMLQHAVSSGWVRGAVTGLGILNLFLAGWEIFHFKQSVRALDGLPPEKSKAKQNAAQSDQTAHLSDN